MWVSNFCDKNISGSSLIYTKKSDPLQTNMIDQHSSSSTTHKNNFKQPAESGLSWKARYILGTYSHLHISCLYNTHKQTFVWFENNENYSSNAFLSEKKHQPYSIKFLISCKIHN